MRRSLGTFILTGALLAALFLTGCRETEDQDGPLAPRPRLLLYCGAGIRTAAAEIVQAFEKKHDVIIQTDYAGSNMLLSRIKLSNKGDLFMPGEAEYVKQAAAEGLVASSRDACYFVPVILVRKGNPENIESVGDLLRDGMRIGFGDPDACAVGKVTDEILRLNGISPADPRLEENVVFRSLTVNELGVHIKAGKIDATIVWDAIASQYPDEGEIVPIPKEKNSISTAPIAVLRLSRHPKEAAAFQEFVVSEEARAIFKKHHYSTALPQ